MSVVEAAVVPWTWLTPRSGRDAPIHRWFTFPHSYAPELVTWLLDEVGIADGERVLDPFCGAGTTVVEAQRLGLPFVASDLLPIAVLATRVKTTATPREDLEAAADDAVARVGDAHRMRPPSPLLRRAFTDTAYARLRCAMCADRASEAVRLGVLSIAPAFARLRADGGWLRVATPALSATKVSEVLSAKLRLMAADAEAIRGPAGVVLKADARRLPVPSGSVGAVVTSPPYPNRHDYTRVFAVELELGFGLRDDVKDLRYQAIHSHPEAHPERGELDYDEPQAITRAVASVREQHPDPRIARMLSGYFRDMHAVCAELRRVLRRGGGAALVVGNAQYVGVPIPVDEWVADVAEQTGLRTEAVTPLRLRGNSAQQMKSFGRRPSRESVVLVRKR